MSFPLEVKKKRWNGDDYVDVNVFGGINMLLGAELRKDVITDTMLDFLGLWEPETTYIYTKLIKKGMVCVDVGAFFGYFTLLFAKLCEDRVFAYEAHESFHKTCQKNVSRNSNIIDSSKVEVYNLAVSDVDDAKLKYNHKLCMIRERGASINTVSLNSLIEYKPQVFKIDVDGHEVAILDGMVDLVKAVPNIFGIIEYAPFCVRDGGFKERDFVDKIFSMFKYVITTYPKYELTTPKQVLRMEKDFGSIYEWSTNLFLTNSKKIANEVLGMTYDFGELIDILG